MAATAGSTPCGPDVGPILERVATYAEAGYDRLYLNQIGARQDEFFEFFREQLGPQLRELGHGS